MWEVVTSHGQRTVGIRHEDEARRAIRALGVTMVISRHSYLVTDTAGRKFTAEIRHLPSPALLGR